MTTTLQTFKTKHYADSVEWCPIAKDSSVLLIGNYQLVEGSKQPESKENDILEPQSRVGRLYVCQLGTEPSEKLLNITEELSHTGILDIKWYRSDINGLSTFSMVDASGQISLYQLEGEEDKHAKQICAEELGSNILGLSLDWSTPHGGDSNPSVIASSSDGRISVWQVTDTGLQNLSGWKGHDFEAWIAAFDYWDTNLAYSGGDDCRFKGWDLRNPHTKPAFVSKMHTMGVCSIQSNPKVPHILATGSYDEQLILWDARSMRSPLKDLSLGGGIWRIKWQPNSGRHILTATMHNGFHIVDTGPYTADPHLRIVAHYTQHESLAYGVDWYQGDQSATEDYILASCSFYDSSVHLWQWKNGTPD